MPTDHKSHDLPSRTAGGGGPARAEAIVPQDVVLVVGIVLVVNQGTKLFAIVLDSCVSCQYEYAC